MILELNEVLLPGEPQTLSLMAEEGKLTCLTGGSASRLTRWLHAILGFLPIAHGFISIDGEPLTDATAMAFRKMMSFAPSALEAQGDVKRYDPPSVQHIFYLKANRECPISNGILAEEMRRVGGDAADQRCRLVAVAALLDKKIMLLDQPPVTSAAYLQRLAAQGRIVLAATNETPLLQVADKVVEL